MSNREINSRLNGMMEIIISMTESGKLTNDLLKELFIDVQSLKDKVSKLEKKDEV